MVTKLWRWWLRVIFKKHLYRMLSIEYWSVGYLEKKREKTHDSETGTYIQREFFLIFQKGARGDILNLKKWKIALIIVIHDKMEMYEYWIL